MGMDVALVAGEGGEERKTRGPMLSGRPWFHMIAATGGNALPAMSVMTVPPAEPSSFSE